MRLFNDWGAEPARLLYRGVKCTQLEPEQNTKTVGRCVCVAKVWMPMNVPCMKLENYLAILHDLFVFIPAMTALATKQLLIPMAAELHIFHGDERLSFHTVNLGQSEQCRDVGLMSGTVGWARTTDLLLHRQAL
jgi:hypothetical protein